MAGLVVGNFVMAWWSKIPPIDLDPLSVVITLLVMIFGLNLLRPFMFLWKLALAPAQLDREAEKKNKRLQRLLDRRKVVPPKLKILFDPQMHISPDGLDYAVGVAVDGKKTVGRAGLLVVDIEPARNKSKLKPLTARMKGGALQWGTGDREFPVDPGVMASVLVLRVFEDSFCLNLAELGPTDLSPRFPLGTYKLTLYAHGKDVQPCKRVFRIGRSRSKVRPINFKVLPE